MDVFGSPIVQAPMAGGWTTPELVAAVLEAGGLGMLAGARLSCDQLRGQIREVRGRSARPFGVNLLVPTVSRIEATGPVEHPILLRLREGLGLPASPEAPPAPPSPDEALEVVLDEEVAVVSFAMGSPAPWVERVHARGARVMASITSVAEAEEAAAAGADAIVAQGAEAGGHRSTFAPPAQGSPPLVGTMALVPQVVDAVGVPVFAAGGIMDGRGIMAALALGARGAQLGTRFLLAAEAGTSPAYRQRLLDAAETDTLVTDVFTGRPARALRNRLVAEWERTGERPLPWPRQGLAAADVYRFSYASDGEWAPLYAGQGLRLARRVQPAAEIVAELRAEMARVREAIAPADMG